MSWRTRIRSVGTILLSVVVVALASSPVLAANRGFAPSAPQEPTADLAQALGADGTFLGASAVAGAVDTNAWTLVSDLAAGEPPRFAPAGLAAATPIGPWSALGALSDPVLAIAVSGSDVYVGGSFTNAGGIAEADKIAKWNGSTWSALGAGQTCTPLICLSDGALKNTVTAIAISGGDVFVGGNFLNADDIPEADFIAMWNSSAWSAVGSNGSGDGAVNNGVGAIAVSGSDVYVGGSFTNAGGIAEADRIAKWNGSAWSALGSNGAGDGALDNGVRAIAISASGVYVGGGFRNAAGISEADQIALWNGSAWSALGSNGAGDGATFSNVNALAISGTALYVGGAFQNLAGIPEADFIAKWEGGSWSALGSNGAGNGAWFGSAFAVVIFGSDLYVGGVFPDAAGIPEADFIAKWDGVSWSALGSNGAGNGALWNGSNYGVLALAVSDSDLYVGGQFVDAAGIAAADNIARWNLVPPTLTSIAVTPSTPTIAAGTDQQFTATGTYSDASTADISGSVGWASATPAVATISATTGLAHGVSIGTSTISASLGAVSGSTLLTVGPPTLTSIAVTPATPTIPAGADQQFTAIGTYSDASTADISGSVGWASATPAVATISTAGLAHGVSIGTSTISATLGAVSGSALLTVTGPVPVLAYTGPTGAVPGATITLSATLKTSAAVAISGKTITFTLDGVTLSSTTNRSGIASVKTTAPATIGSYPIGVAFAGDTTYSAASTSQTLEVRIATKLAYTGPTRVASGATITLSATLKTAARAAIPGMTVTFTFNGVSVPAVTDAFGVASVVTTAPAAGKYPVGIVFAGDLTYAAALTSATITVR